jgi:predicted TIM-barrel fold metal-dependent hydrolase
MFSDCHIHCRPDADGSEVLKAMDKREMDRAVLIAPSMTDSNETLVESIGIIKRICEPDPERLVGFAWIEPTLSDAVDHVKMAADAGLPGVKMIPNHWYPYEERFYPVYEAIQEARKPLLFHSGILFGRGDCSRFCRPVFYEVMVHFPKVKFALAHISWPWTDECIAVAGRMRAAVGYKTEDMRMFIDITRGTPDYYRVDALDKALRYIGPTRIMFGSDDRAPGGLGRARQHIDGDYEIICKQLAQPESAFRQIASETFEDFLTPVE